MDEDALYDEMRGCMCNDGEYRLSMLGGCCDQVTVMWYCSNGGKVDY